MTRRLNTDEIDDLFQQIGELKDALHNVARPPEHVIYDDVQLRDLLKVSKRTTAYWRERGLITFSKLGGKIYYKLSDILSLLKQREVSAIHSSIKIAL